MMLECGALINQMTLHSFICYSHGTKNGRHVSSRKYIDVVVWKLHSSSFYEYEQFPRTCQVTLCIISAHTKLLLSQSPSDVNAREKRSRRSLRFHDTEVIVSARPFWSFEDWMTTLSWVRGITYLDKHYKGDHPCSDDSDASIGSRTFISSFA